MAEDPGATRPTERSIGLGLGLLFALFVAISWGKWPLLTADSARELYVPFQIRHGALIYRDFFYLYGPLAPYLDAGLLGLFGDRLEVLYAANLANLAADMALLYALARQVLAARFSAAVVLLFFSHFALGRDIWGYVWPYASAATFGVTLGLVLLWALARHAASGRLGWLVLAGVAVGLSLVDKLEYGFAAGMLALAYGLVRALWARSLASWTMEALALVVPALAIASLIAGTVLTRVPIGTVLDSVWPVALMKLWNSTGTWKGSPGTWLNNLKWLGFDAAVLGLVLALGAIAQQAKRSVPVRFVLAAGAALLVTLAALAIRHAGATSGLGFFWLNAPVYWMGPGFLLLFGVLVWVARRLWTARRRGEAPEAATVVWGLVALYGCLVASRTLMSGYNDYTRYQAPVTLIVWVALAALWLPAWARARGWLDAGSRGVYAALAGLVLLLCGSHFVVAAREYLAPQVAVSGPHGTVWAPSEFAVPFNQTVAFLRAHTRPGELLVAGPMEASLFTFSGCENALKEDQLFYGYLTTPAEQAEAIQRIQALGVRYVVLSNFGYGTKRFGRDYMQDLDAWIEGRCRLVADYSASPPGRDGQPAYRLRVFATPAASQALAAPAAARGGS